MSKYKKVSLDKLNETIARLRNEGFMYETMFARVSDAYSRIISDTKAHRGEILSMEQANERIQKTMKEKARLFTKEEYESEVSNLMNTLGSKTYRGVLRQKRNEMIEIIRDAEDYTEMDAYDLSKISTVDLNEMFKRAHDLAQNDSKGSQSFYDHLIAIINEEE